MSDRVALTIVDGIADVRLNRPDKLNALDRAMFEGLVAAGEALAAMHDLRAVVLSGEGRSFCVGIDLEWLQQGGAAALGDLMPRSHGDANLYQQAVMQWRALPVPVIAAVQGHAFGGGFQIMLGADIRIIAPATKLSVMEIRHGLVPDMGGIALMRHFARDDVIRRLTLTGAQFSGAEAQGFGFATDLADDPRAAAQALAHQIAEANPAAIRAAKRLLNQAAEGASDASLLLAESQEQTPLIMAHLPAI